MVKLRASGRQVAKADDVNGVFLSTSNTERDIVTTNRQNAHKIIPMLSNISLDVHVQHA